jgi:hypothetical protein
MSAPLASASVTIDATGKGTVSLGPSRYGEKWEVSLLSVQNTGALNPEISVYRDMASPTSFVESTRNGNSDSSDTKYSLRAGERLVVQTVGGSVGSTTTVTVSGTASR